jgi:glycerol-3-phosphate dehydrogenase
LSGPAWTGHTPLPGGDFPTDGQPTLIAGLRATHPFLSEDDATRIVRAYGTRASRWLGEAKDWADLGRNFGAGLSEAELRYLVDVEWARTAEDALWRRSKLGLHMDEPQRAAVAEWFG